MNYIFNHVIDDVRSESIELDILIKDLPEDIWDIETTPEGWTIYDQIAHLTMTDEASLFAINAPIEFADHVNISDTHTLEMAEARELRKLASLPKDQLLTRWRRSRESLATALSQADPNIRIPWYGPPMKRVSMATARMMETWAHSLDIYDALGKTKPQNDRVRHVCEIGIRTRGYVHQLHGHPIPESDIAIQLQSPSGQTWSWGPDETSEKITGKAWDFAMLATRRRHRDDVNVTATGIASDRWLNIIQTFAGNPGANPVRLAERPNRSDQRKADT